jgi:ureidoglycolate lyase
MIVIPREPDPAAFSAFGALVDGPAMHGDRRLYSNWLTPVPNLALQFHINSVERSDLPLVLNQIERHPHAAQVFLPLDVSRYVVTVMPDRGGLPDPAGVLSMILPGTTGVIYRPGAWHTGVTVLDRDGQFAVLMWRGASDDDVFAAIDPLIVSSPALGQKSRP